MKKFSFFLSFFMGINIFYAQLPVSQTPENKNVILEEFTGMHCTYCPDGHRIAQEIYDAHPGDVVLINIHTGSFAAPSGSEPDFRTQFGSALASQSGLTGYPSGTINRHLFGHSQSGDPNDTALSRSTWTSDANTILGESAYCNVALEASIDVQTRVMTVDVEVYFTADSPAAENYINVALLQNNVEGPQTGSNLNPDQVLPNGNYNHMHMLRHLITGQWGELLSANTQGTLLQLQYTYNLPMDINGVPLELGNLEIAAFVAEGHQEINNGSLGVINFTNLNYTTNAAISDTFFNDEICSPNELDPKISIYNNGQNPITSLDIEYSINGGTAQTYNWTGNINSLATETIDLPDPSFTVDATNTMNIQLTSINGSPADDNTSDNTTAFTFIKTPNKGEGTDYIVTIVQDRYGNETTWAILDENESVIANGGPYTQLSSNTTETHTHNVTISSSGCYKFVILDSYGDGINGGYGQGNYSISQADGTLVLYGDGHFGSMDWQAFEIDATTAVDENISAEVEVFPNPARDIISITQAKDMHMAIFDVAGKLILERNIDTDKAQIPLDSFANGMYFIRFTKDNQTGTKKFIVKK